MSRRVPLCYSCRMAGSLVAPGLSDHHLSTVRNLVFSNRVADISKAPACSNRDHNWWLQAGRPLEKRYTLIRRLSADSYSAEDRFLSQRVIVTRLPPASGAQGRRFFLALQSLASIRHPNFLNVIEVICAGHIALFITESPQGASLAALSEKRRFDLEDTMRLLPLNGFEYAAEHLLFPNVISTRSLYIGSIGEQEGTSDFERQPISAWPPFIVRLDVSEIARPQHRCHLPFSTDRRDGVKRWTVRQTALLISELLGIPRWPQARVKSFRPSSYSLNYESRAALSKAARGIGPYEDAESLLWALESVSKSPPIRRTQNHLISPLQKPVVNLLRGRSLLPFDAISSAIGRMPVALTRSVVLSALGATMLWLFSPPQRKALSGSDRILVESASIPLTTAQATEAVQESIPIAAQPSSDIAPPKPDLSPAPSLAPQADRSQNASARLTGSSHHTLPAPGSGRRLSANRGRATSRYRTFFRNEIANFRVRLISFWRRNPFSANRHH
jgi:hypothetical protein